MGTPKLTKHCKEGETVCRKLENGRYFLHCSIHHNARMIGGYTMKETVIRWNKECGRAGALKKELNAASVA